MGVRVPPPGQKKRNNTLIIKELEVPQAGGRPQTRPPVIKSQLHAAFLKEKSEGQMLYKPAELYKGPNEWYIFYFFYNASTGKMQRFKERFNINRIRDIAARTIHGAEYVKFINQKLKDGFNPFTAITTTSLSKGSITEQLEDLVKMLCIDAARSAPKTYRQVKCRFIKFIKAEKLTDISLQQVNEDVAKRFKKYMVAAKLSPKTMNVTVSHLGLFWDHAIAEKMVTGNPFRLIKPTKKDHRKKDIYEPITFAEMKKIFDWLNENGQRGFVRFLAMIYYAWARPVEITRLQVEDIDLINDVITFHADETKNDKGASVQIVPMLKEMLLEMNLAGCKGSDYLFSGKNFLPGAIQKDSNKIGEKWRVLIQSGLKIKKLMYALKHTGNIHYLLNNKGNVDLKWQQMQNRHSSAAMTEKYNRGLGAYFIDTSDLKFNQI